jgi:hypothetical protein
MGTDGGEGARWGAAQPASVKTNRAAMFFLILFPVPAALPFGRIML